MQGFMGGLPLPELSPGAQLAVFAPQSMSISPQVHRHRKRQRSICKTPVQKRSPSRSPLLKIPKLSYQNSTSNFLDTSPRTMTTDVIDITNKENNLNIANVVANELTPMSIGKNKSADKKPKKTTYTSKTSSSNGNNLKVKKKNLKNTKEKEKMQQLKDAVKECGLKVTTKGLSTTEAIDLLQRTLETHGVKARRGTKTRSNQIDAIKEIHELHSELQYIDRSNIINISSPSLDGKRVTRRILAMKDIRSQSESEPDEDSEFEIEM